MAPIALSSPMGALAGGIGLSLVGIFGMNKGQMTIQDENGCLVSYNDTTRKAAYCAVVAGLGITMSPLIGITLATNPAVLVKAMLATGATFAGCSVFAHMRPKGSMLYL